MGPPLLRLCYPIQPRRENHHATTSECTAHVTPNQETTTKVSGTSVETSADAPRTCHVSESEPLHLSLRWLDIQIKRSSSISRIPRVSGRHVSMPRGGYLPSRTLLESSSARE